MKILQINSVCGVGSTGRIATDINKLLVDQGHESFIAYGRGKSRGEDNTIKIGTNFDNYSHVALTRILDRHGFGSRRATEDFIKEIIKLDPDVIHLHNIHGYYINIQILFDYLKESNKPVIWTLHDCWPFTGHCTYFDYAGCSKWKSECSNCPEKKAYPSSNFVDNSKKNYLSKKHIFNGIKNLMIVTPSEWLAGLLKESFLSDYPVKVINNGIDLQTFKPVESNFRQRYNLEKDFLILGVASVWDRRKGFKYFIELSKKLNKDDKIILVGLTEKQIAELPNNIIGICKTNNTEELVEIYSSVDVFVNPTLEDNFPTTNIEAMACGTPIVAFDTGGVKEQIKNEVGALVKKGDINALLNSIYQFKKNKKSNKNLSVENAYLLYSKESKYQEYIDLYEDMLNEEDGESFR